MRPHLVKQILSHTLCIIYIIYKYLWKISIYSFFKTCDSMLAMWDLQKVHLLMLHKMAAHTSFYPEFLLNQVFLVLHGVSLLKNGKKKIYAFFKTLATPFNLELSNFDTLFLTWLYNIGFLKCWKNEFLQSYCPFSNFL